MLYSLAPSFLLSSIQQNPPCTSEASDSKGETGGPPGSNLKELLPIRVIRAFCTGVGLKPRTWSFSDMLWYIPSSSPTPRRRESERFSWKGIDIETQPLEIGKVPSEG